MATLDFARPVSPSPDTATGTLLTLAGAARDRRPLAFTYAKPSSPPEERRIDPYGLVFHGGKWFVTGHDHDRAELRTFRLDRITAATPLDGTFAVPSGFDPAAHVAAGLATSGWRHEVSVVLHTTLAEARRRIPPTAATLTETTTGVRLTTRAEHLDGMARLLAGLGHDFTVETPEALRTELTTLATHLTTAAERR